MTTEIPVKVYEAIVEINKVKLIEAVEANDYRTAYRSFDRLMHALEQVEQYKAEEKGK